MEIVLVYTIFSNSSNSGVALRILGVALTVGGKGVALTVGGKGVVLAVGGKCVALIVGETAASHLTPACQLFFMLIRSCEEYGTSYILTKIFYYIRLKHCVQL